MRLRHQTWSLGRVVIAEIGGIVFELHLDEVIDSSIYLTGSFEPNTSAVISRLCLPGHVALDIGANVGCHTLPMAKLVGGNGRVHAFEPMPWARARLGRNLALNSFANVRVHDLALSDTAHWSVAHFRSSWRRIGPDRSAEAAASRDRHVVSFVRLDDFLTGEGIERVDFVKLDVDGHELKTLRGASRMLETCAPVLVLELGDYTLAAVGDSLPELISFLSERGYRFYREPELRPIESSEAVIASVPPDGTINVVASSRPLS